MTLGAVAAVVLSVQAAASEPAADVHAHAYLARCEAAGQAMTTALATLERDRGVVMADMKAGTARFVTGIERLRVEAATREALSDEQVAADRSAGQAAVTGVPLVSILSIMDGCEAAHEVMD